MSQDDERLAYEPYQLIWDDTDAQIGTYESPEAAYAVVRRLVNIYHDNMPPLVLIHVAAVGVHPCADGQQLIQEAMEDEQYARWSSRSDGNTADAPQMDEPAPRVRHPNVSRGFTEHPASTAHALLRARQSTGESPIRPGQGTT